MILVLCTSSFVLSYHRVSELLIGKDFQSDIFKGA